MTDQAAKHDSKLHIILKTILFGLPALVGIGWIMGLPVQLGISVLDGNYLAFLIAFSLAASFIYWPYGDRAGVIDYILAISAFGAWILCSYFYEDWLLTQHERTVFKVTLAVVAILLICEGVRKTAGNGMATVILASLL